MNTLKKEHHNSAIEELVLNSTSTQFYKEAHNRIYPKIGQIYLEPDNNWGRAPFYSHEKKFAGYTFSTFTFNLLMLGICALLVITIAAITFGMVSCNSSKKQDAAEQKVEEEAAIAGEVSKGLLTAELKDEVTRFLKDMPDSELPYKVSTGEVTISVANTDFMLPVSKVSELNTQAQKARACGIYFADLNVLKAMKKPTTDIENVLVKLTTDLDIPFAIDIMKESAPANASKEELSKFMKD